MDEELERFLARDSEYGPKQFDKLWPFRAVREALGLPLDPDRYRAFGSGRTLGNFAFKGKVSRGGPLKCDQCGGLLVFEGSYATEHERVMYSELGGFDDEDTYWTDVTFFYVCLSCEYMRTAADAQYLYPS